MSAPFAMHLTPEQPIAGILAPLFALRSAEDLGVGDTRCLRELAEWASSLEFRLIQLLPINETGNDNSPYNAISSAAIDPTTIETVPGVIEDLTPKDFSAITGEYDLEALREGAVNYRQVKRLKRQLLEKAFERFLAGPARRNTARARRFRDFMAAEEAWLEGYTFFRALMDENGGSEVWDRWKPGHRTVGSAREWAGKLRGSRRKAFENRRRFFAYVQWIAFTQWRELKRWCDARGVALMGDVPFGVSYYSADVFVQPELFDLQWSGGAPPEPYFKDDLFTQKWGQNWGVPIYRWSLMSERGGYAWWRRRVRVVREMFHLFRVDHVLGFYRIYGFPWRPERNAEFLPLTPEEARARTGGRLPGFIPRNDDTFENKEGNRRDGETYLRALVAEVGEHRLIGEDLGTVPDYVRPSLTSLGIAGFKIPIWERKPDNWLVDGPQYERLSVATYATHDHEPLRALWEHWRKAATSRDAHEAAHASDEMRKLGGFADLANADQRPWSDELHLALVRALCRSNSWIVIFMITDLLGSERRFNVPGTAADSNWSARLQMRPDEWTRDVVIGPKLPAIAAALRESGRAS